MVNSASFSAAKARSSVPRVDSQPGREANTPYDEFVLLDPHRHRFEQGQSAGFVLQDSARTPDRPGGEHHPPVPGDPVQLQQVPRSPLRALERRTSTTRLAAFFGAGADGTRQARTPRARTSVAAAVEGAPSHSTRSSARTCGRGRGDPRAHRRGDGTGISLHSRSSRNPTAFVDPKEDPRPRDAMQLAAWLTSGRQRLLCAMSYANRIWGYLLGSGHHRTAGRHPRRQSADQSRAAQPPDRISSWRVGIRCPRADARRSASRAPTSCRSPPTSGTRMTRSTSLTRRPGVCRQRCFTTRCTR